MGLCCNNRAGLLPFPQDIRNQRQHRQRRRAELTQLRRTLFGLHSKRTFCEEQVDFYSQYIQSSLDSLTTKSKCVAKSGLRSPLRVRVRYEERFSKF